jgi:uncharacterized protein YndB with AHSA1/START domain
MATANELKNGPANGLANRPANEAGPEARPPPLVASRVFPVPRQLVFQAWSSAEHLKRWFCPACFTVPEAELDFRVGGIFNICMRAPDGKDYWSRGHIVELVPDSRLVIDMSAIGDSGAPQFRAYTTVTFAQEGGGTRMEVTQEYTLFDAVQNMLDGAPQGWRETLDRLEVEVQRIRQLQPASRSVTHGIFHIERSYQATRAQVFRALTDPAAKAKWFGGGDGYTVLAREMDARPGGREFLKGRWDSGMESTFEAFYYDIVPNERVIYSYQMHLDGRKISVSLASLELKAEGAGTRLLLTEQGAFLDGLDDDGSRERGSRFLLERLARSLGEQETV